MENIYELIYEPNEVQGVFGISLVRDPAINVEALQFSKEVPSNVIDSLIRKGEVEPKGNWKLIDTKEITDSYSFNDINSTSDLLSEQDSELFKVRYKYAPQSVNLRSRELCRKLVSANKVYRKEDIDEASRSGVNGQFAKKGESTYDLWLFKGGSNCKHRWQRVIYFNNSNKELTYMEALKKIASLPKDVKKTVKLPDNDSRVGQVASASNNYWRMSSEEKRVLVSPVLIPDQKIFRSSTGQDGKPGYVFTSAETIERLQQNFFKEKYNHNSSIEHLYPIDEGVFIFESWIIEDPNNDKSNALGFNLPKGTWMVSMKIENDTIWKDYIKTGKIGGLSMDAMLLSKKVNNNNILNLKEMNKQTFSAMLKKALVKKVSFNADLNEFVINENLSVFATELVVGAIVMDVDGNILTEVNFDYNGMNYVTDVEGVIVEINEVVVDNVEQLELSDEMLEEALEEVKEEIVSDYESQIEALNAEIAELKLKLADAEVKVEEAVEFRKQSKGSKGVKLGFSKDVKTQSKGILGAVRNR